VPVHLIVLCDASPTPPSLHSFPTRRSSDLDWDQDAAAVEGNYNDSNPVTVAMQLDSAVTSAGGLLDGLDPAVYRRKGQRSDGARSEEHTSELQSRFDLVCRLLLEKKKNK